MRRDCVEFVDGRTEKFDAIILATGYKSNVPSWLKVILQMLHEQRQTVDLLSKSHYMHLFHVGVTG